MKLFVLGVDKLSNSIYPYLISANCSQPQPVFVEAPRNQNVVVILFELFSLFLFLLHF
jgi:hypothetical protein